MDKDIENASLKEAIERHRSAPTQENRLWLLHELIDAELILPVVIIPQPVNNKIPEDATVNYFSMQTRSGQTYLAVFSSLEEMGKWNKNPNKMYLVRSYESIKHLVLSNREHYDGFVLDPMGCNIAVRNELMENVERLSPGSDTLHTQRVETEGNSGLLPAYNPPERLAEALKKYFASQDNIKSAYFMQTVKKGEKKPTYVIVVDFCRDGSLKNAFDGIAAVAHSVLAEDEEIGLMPAFDKTAAGYIKGVRAFYEKE